MRSFTMRVARFLLSVRTLSLCILFGQAAAAALAACHVVTPTGSGTKSGADWNNAYAGLPSTLVRGDIYYLADGTYGHFQFSTPSSGTATIEIRKAQSYDNCVATGWNKASMGSSQAVWQWGGGSIWNINSSYLIVNGNGNDPAGTIGCGGVFATPPASMTAAPPTPSDCGIKIDDSTCTSTANNGCDGGAGVIHGGGNNITFENVEWKGQGLNASGNNNSETYFWETGSGQPANVVITSSYLHNASTTYYTVASGGWNNGSFDHNYVWGLFDGSVNHGEAIQLQGNNANDAIHHNIFRDQQTNGDIVSVTAGGGNLESGMIIYDNVDFCSPGGTSTSCRHNDGWIGCFNSQACSGYLVYNNTLSYPSDCGWNVTGSSSSTLTVENNLYYGCGNVTMTGGTVTQDYNSYLNSNHSAIGSHDISSNSAPNPFASGTSPALASDNSLWNNRVSLSSPYSTDILGEPFTSDRGAFQFEVIPPPINVTGSVATQ